MWCIILFVLNTSDIILESTEAQDEVALAIWFYVAIVELLIIVFLLWKLNRRKSESIALNNISKEKLREAGKADVDMENLMNSINKSRDLYKDLSRTCHPDRFINTDKEALAQEIFQEVSRNKRNHKNLTALKIRAEKELGITI